VWGNGTSGTSTHNDLVTVLFQIVVPVYGREFAGQNVTVGSYSDSVVATIALNATSTVTRNSIIEHRGTSRLIDPSITESQDNDRESVAANVCNHLADDGDVRRSRG
jgi:hypothetical protein